MGEQRWLVGIDDTDAGDSIGTGALARELALYLARTLGAKTAGVTRHQLLVHPDIPYTSHNSAACIELRCDADREAVMAAGRTLLGTLFHPGADPGLCVTGADAVRDGVLDFARRAQREVVDEAEARELARQHGVRLEGLGGTELGVIGALCACALRAGGDDGRFIALGAIRELPEQLTAGAILERTPIAAVVGVDGNEVPADAEITTNRWVRPDLRGGRIVLEVQPLDGGGYQIVKKKKR